MTDARVTALSLTAIKGTRLRSVDSVALEAGGARGDRRFFVVDERGRMVNGKQLGELQRVVASYAQGMLTLELPDGAVVRAPVQPGEPIRARFYSRTLDGRMLAGPLSDALSETCGQPLRLVEAKRSAVDRGAGGAVTLISQASLQRLASEAALDGIDARRFRMLIEIEGVAAHEEDQWVGRRVRVGQVQMRCSGHVGRCLITSREPETGEVDLPTLELLRAYRGEIESTEPLPFGIYGQVVRPGEVRVGDAVSPVQ